MTKLIIISGFPRLKNLKRQDIFFTFVKLEKIIRLKYEF